jgi:MFS family permease
VTAEEEKPTRVRHVVIFLLVLHYANTYMDRVVIAQAGPSIRGEFGLSQTELGVVFTAFTLAYALFQVPGGWLADRFGPRKILTGIVSYWSIFTMATAAAWNRTSLIAIRFLFGAGEAGAFPAATRAFSRWLPATERGIAQGVTHSGARLAGAFTPPLVGLMIVQWGWRSAFIAFGLLGFVWGAAWYWYYRDEPEDHPGVNAAELAVIREEKAPASKISPAAGILSGHDASASDEADGTGGEVGTDEPPVEVDPKEEGVPWRILLRSRNMWLLSIMYLCYVYSFWIYLTWTPTYLVEERGFGIVASGVGAGLPLFAGALTNSLGGWYSDRLSAKRGLTIGRRLPAIAGFLAGAAFIVPGVLVEDAYLAVAFLTLAAAGLEFTTGVSWATAIDVGHEHAGTVSAFMNMMGNLGGALSPFLFGVLVDWTGRWELPFLIASVMIVIAALLWLRIDPEKSVLVE